VRTTADGSMVLIAGYVAFRRSVYNNGDYINFVATAVTR
jgi:hypothetical protein